MLVELRGAGAPGKLRIHVFFQGTHCPLEAIARPGTVPDYLCNYGEDLSCARKKIDQLKKRATVVCAWHHVT